MKKRFVKWAAERWPEIVGIFLASFMTIQVRKLFVDERPVCETCERNGAAIRGAASELAALARRHGAGREAPDGLGAVNEAELVHGLGASAVIVDDDGLLEISEAETNGHAWLVVRLPVKAITPFLKDKCGCGAGDSGDDRWQDVVHEK